MVGATKARRTSRLATLLQGARARPRFALGYVIVLAAVAAGALAPLLAPYSPIEANPAEFLQPPSAQHWLGTDAVGMDIFSRVIYAPRIDLAIAVAGTLLSAVVGCLAGGWVG